MTAGAQRGYLCTRTGARIDQEFQGDARWCSGSPPCLHPQRPDGTYEHARPAWETAPITPLNSRVNGARSDPSTSERANGTRSETSPPRERPWPKPLAPPAFHGPLGDFVMGVAPVTEADPAAVLVQAASLVGTYIGPAVRAVAGNAPHPAKVYVLIIGPTATGRKGTSYSVAEQPFRVADELFIRDRITTGLVSGEGLIYEVRDAATSPARKGEEPDPGVTDKRRGIVETEFSGVLRAGSRDGSTLMATIRQAWDGGNLRTMAKNAGVKATGAHVNIIAHIAPDELTRYLDRSELAGGLINRFLLVASQISKRLPDGEESPADVVNAFARHLGDVRRWATAPGGHRLRRDDAARDLWHKAYPDLTRERRGLFGAATSRAEAQVLRLSVTYAALDRSEVIRADHLLAALEVWRYCEASARWAFGDATGDPTADAILSALRRSSELDRNDIYELLGRHARRERIEQALKLLAALGLATVKQGIPTGGRPRDVWSAC